MVFWLNIGKMAMLFLGKFGNFKKNFFMCKLLCDIDKLLIFEWIVIKLLFKFLTHINYKIVNPLLFDLNSTHYFSSYLQIWAFQGLLLYDCMIK